MERVHPEDLPLVQEAFDRASQQGANLDLEHRLLMPNDSSKHARVLGHAVEDQSDFVGAVMDITAIKKAFEEIQSLRDQLYKENLAQHDPSGCL